MTDITGGVFTAVPFTATDPAKVSYIVDRLVEHDAQWTDFQADMAHRKVSVASVLADGVLGLQTAVFEVWRLEGEAELVGVLMFTKIIPHVEAEFHPVFFDGKLRNLIGKRLLLLRALDAVFHAYDLHRVAVQVPETAFALIEFCRRKLGFRYEGEGREIRVQRVVPHGHHKARKFVALTPSWREAAAGSRRYQVFRKGGRWLDLILLSLTREEFGVFVREESCPPSASAVSLSSPPPSKPSPVTSKT